MNSAVFMKLGLYGSGKKLIYEQDELFVFYILAVNNRVSIKSAVREVVNQSYLAET